MRPSHIALAVLVTAIWGVNFVVIEVGLDHFPPLLFSALRFLVAAVPAVFFVGRPEVALDGVSPLDRSRALGDGSSASDWRSAS